MPRLLCTKKAVDDVPGIYNPLSLSFTSIVSCNYLWFCHWWYMVIDLPQSPTFLLYSHILVLNHIFPSQSCLTWTIVWFDLRRLKKHEPSLNPNLYAMSGSVLNQKIYVQVIVLIGWVYENLREKSPYDPIYLMGKTMDLYIYIYLMVKTYGFL